MPLVVDASVAVKWVFAEPYDGAVRRLVTSDETMAAPDLIWAELANAAWKRAHRGVITAQEARRALSDLRGLPIETYESGPMAEAALEWALALGITCYDALYLALAEALGIPLVTADRRLFDAATKGPLRRRAIWIADL